jgi:hypothetical protein
MMNSFIICSTRGRDQIKDDDMGREVALTREVRNTKFWSENLKGRKHLGDLSVDV